MAQAGTELTTNVRPLSVVPQRRRELRREPRSVRQMRKQMMVGLGVGVVMLTLTGLSLSHLAHGIEIATNAPSWECWALAIGIDLGFVSFVVAALVAASEHIRRSIVRITRPAEIGTLAASAVFNGFAFAATAPESLVMKSVAVLLGVVIPILIYALTRVATIMWVSRG